jgi:hypothetical protein
VLIERIRFDSMHSPRPSMGKENGSVEVQSRTHAFVVVVVAAAAAACATRLVRSVVEFLK